MAEDETLLEPFDDPPPMLEPTKEPLPVVEEAFEIVNDNRTGVIAPVEVPAAILEAAALQRWIVRHATHGKATVLADDEETAKDAFCSLKKKPRSEVEAVYELHVAPFVTADTEK